MIELAPSSYYYQPKPDPKLDQEITIRNRIEAIHEQFPVYGYRRVRHQLLREGICVNTKKIRRIMRENSFFPVVVRAFRISTTDSKHGLGVFPNLLKKRKLVGPDEAWAADITYIRLRQETVFLAALLDLYSRKIIGWAISRKMNRELCLEALRIALNRRNPRQGCIHHSDRGSQYACREYVALLQKHGIQISMSRPGNPYDNAFMESFYKTLKSEEVHLKHYETLQDVLKSLPAFIEEVYNRQRLHSSLNYRPPEEFEAWIQTLEPADRPALQL